jgi:hypothetical protein
MKLLRTIISIALLMAIWLLPSMACPTGCTPGDTVKYANPGQSITVALSGTADPAVTYTWVVLMDNGNMWDSLTKSGVGAAGASYTFNAPTVPGEYWIKLAASVTNDPNCITYKCIHLWVRCPSWVYTYCYGTTATNIPGYTPPMGYSEKWSYKLHSEPTVWTADGTGVTPNFLTTTLPAGTYDVRLEIKFGALVVKTCDYLSALVVTPTPSAAFACTSGCSDNQ